MVIKSNYIPFTKLKYKITETSLVLDENDNIVKTKLINNIEFIELDFLNDKKDYEVGFLLLLSFGFIDYCPNVYKYIKIIYKDGDTRNTYLYNLTYVFIKPIESKIKNFYLIPFLSNYAIDKKGNVINLTTLKIKKWSKTKGDIKRNKLPGYEYNQFVLSNGKSKMMYKHRLLCLVFKEIKGIYNKLTVNHLDGDKNNSTLDNLEWCTYSENNKHAWDNRLKLNNRDKIYMRNIISNEIKVFRSIRECSYYLGDNSGFYVSNRIKDKSNKIYPDLLQFKRGENTSWPEIDTNILKDYKLIGFENQFVVRNIFTGEVLFFDNAIECSKNLNVSVTAILNHSRNRVIRPNGKYNFRYLFDINTFPEFNKDELDILRIFNSIYKKEIKTL